MKLVQPISLSALALALALSVSRAEDNPPHATRLAEHPAVLVARQGVHRDPTMNFYLHPARMTWSLERPGAGEEYAGEPIAHPESVSAVRVQARASGAPRVALQPVAVTAAAAIR